MAAAKARGVILGRQGADVAGMARVRSEQTADFRAAIYPTIKRMRDNGDTLTVIADTLNQMQIKTCNDRVWYPFTVSQLLKRAEQTAGIANASAANCEKIRCA